MKRVILWSFLFLVVLVGSAVVHIPANLVLRQLPPIQGLELSGVSGTLWNGSAAKFSWQGQPMGTLKWQFNPLKLFTGKADVDLRLSGTPGLSARGNVGYSLGGIYANNLLLSASANIVQSFIPYPLPVSLSGQFDLTVRDYLFAQQPFCEVLAGNLAWSQGNVASPIGTIEPGLVVAQLSCNEGQLVLDGDSASDAIETEFNISLSPDQRYSLNGWFAPGDDFPEGMRGQLGFLGNPDSEGRYRLSFSG
ncbi:type II secretion system protein N [Grimontia kaedaensis]|uniref:Type II secretion system protein N n=1 Tax=Grimontia kaedaensis TaxID=2872157 RepID=A0ABY4WWS9_9GAMM|nr:type II secretion system protein N [Grimontia kaedaensis]USH02347.1 type II secretion system protein N [Grimontia kaedaensis]